MSDSSQHSSPRPSPSYTTPAPVAQLRRSRCRHLGVQHQQSLLEMPRQAKTYSTFQRKWDSLRGVFCHLYVMFSTALHGVARRLHQQGFSIRRVAEIIKVTKSTIHRWIHGIAKSRCPKQKPLHIIALQSFVDSDPFKTLTGYFDWISPSHDRQW